jgi:arginase
MPPPRLSAPVAVLDAPSNLGLMPPAPGREPGVRRLPDALRARGLVGRLAAIDAGRVPAPRYGFEIDPRTGVRNAAQIASYARTLADAIEGVLTRGLFPLVLGGDCSVLLGSALALRRRGRYGLVFLDGHQDLLTPETSHSKGAAGMDLALACGCGPEALTSYDGVTPLLDPRDVVLLGDRSGDEEYPDPWAHELRTRMLRAGLEAWRTRGIATTLQHGLSRLRQQVTGVWVHVDADVLDHEIMPAVDSPQPNGLSWEEFHEALVSLLASDCVVGMQLTILDPELDPEGRYAEALTTALEGAFRVARAQPA